MELRAGGKRRMEHSSASLRLVGHGATPEGERAAEVCSTFVLLQVQITTGLVRRGEDGQGDPGQMRLPGQGSASDTGDGSQRTARAVDPRELPGRPDGQPNIYPMALGQE